MDTGVATVGYSDLSDPYNVLENAVKIGGGNAIGYIAGNRMLGRGTANVLRANYNAMGSGLSNMVAKWFDTPSDE